MHTAQLATRVMASVPATVVEVGRTAVTALVPPADLPRVHVEKLVTDVARADNATRAPASSGPRERFAALSSAIPVRVAVKSRLRADHHSEHGAGGIGGPSWLPSCVGAASAGFTAGHDHNCGDAIQESAAVYVQPLHCGHGVLHRTVASAEIQPGVTPD